MAPSRSISKIFGRCPSCGAEYVARRRRDGTVEPVGEASECECTQSVVAA